MANPLKKLLVVVNFTDLNGTALDTAIVSLQSESAKNYPDRIFFVQNTGEIITHGVKFGASQKLIDHVAALETGFTKLAGISSANAALEEAAITDDSLIGKYVLAHTSKVEGTPDHGIEVTPSTDANKTTTYTVDLNAETIIDNATVVLKDGKIASGVQIKYTSAAQNANGQVTAVDGELGGNGHPILSLVDSKGAYINSVDVNDFVVDGMIKEVKETVDEKGYPAIEFVWNTDGGDKSTVISLNKVFRLEQIHTGTEDYLTVKTTTPTDHDTPHPGDEKGGICYEVSAKVDTTDLTATSTVTLGDDGNYKSNIGDSVNDKFAAIQGVKGLADANLVAKKFVDADKKTVIVANDIIARLKAFKDAQGTKDTEQDEKIADHETRIATNKAAIDKLNGDEKTDGSVAKSILDKLKEFKESLDSSAEYADANGLVTVTTSIVDGEVNAATSKVVIKKDNLVVNTDADGEYLIGNVNYKAKGLDQIADNDPSLVTSKDAWVYGQCIKNQAIKEIASDNNEYIHITRENNTTKVVFEPWIEVHTISELESKLTY